MRLLDVPHSRSTRSAQGQQVTMGDRSKLDSPSPSLQAIRIPKLRPPASSRTLIYLLQMFLEAYTHLHQPQLRESSSSSPAFRGLFVLTSYDARCQGQQIRFLEWLSDAATPISLGRLFDGGISTDVHLPTLLACGQPIIERRSPFALEIQSHLSLPDPCDQGDYLAALRCIHSTLDCTGKCPSSSPGLKRLSIRT